MATSAELQAKIERERLELVALRNKAAALPDGPERDAIQAQRDALRAQQKTTTRELEVATSQSPAIGQFEGVDANSGEYRYKNPETGTSFLSPTAPTQAQQQQSGQTAPTPAAPPLPTEARPETAPAEVQTPAAQPQFVETVSPADVPAASVPAPPPAPAVAATNAPAGVDLEPVPESANASSSFTGAPAPVDTSLLTPTESIARAQVSAPESVDAATFNANTNAGVLGAIGAAPAPVDSATDPGVKSPFGGAASNAAAARNPEAAAAALQQEKANQSAAAGLKAREQQALAARFNTPANGDWRVRLRLAPQATYLYRDTKNTLLAPLAASDGVVFPYTPTIQTSYNANYESTDLTHSNYKGYFYKSSNVGDISISGIFTAQDTKEAEYVLAVIHFFRSVTKMFYGQDAERGAPPPLVYLYGMGQYQFSNNPCVVSSFSYSLPNDVDYIRTVPNNFGTNFVTRTEKTSVAPINSLSSVVNRLSTARDLLGRILQPGAKTNVPDPGQVPAQSVNNISNATYVPTKIEIAITLHPMQTRSQQSQQFSVKEFSNGNLLKGGFW